MEQTPEDKMLLGKKGRGNNVQPHRKVPNEKIQPDRQIEQMPVVGQLQKMEL